MPDGTDFVSAVGVDGVVGASKKAIVDLCEQT